MTAVKRARQYEQSAREATGKVACRVHRLLRTGKMDIYLSFLEIQRLSPANQGDRGHFIGHARKTSANLWLLFHNSCFYPRCAVH